jgi:hypothetical protein
MEDKVDGLKSKEKETKVWRKSIKIGDTEDSVEVRKISNGFLVVKNKSYKNDDGWQYDTKEEFSKTNPLENDGDATDKPSIKDLYTGMFGEGTDLAD